MDTETNSLEDDSVVIEIGAVLYSVQNRTSLVEFSSLMPGESNEAEAVNRIKAEALREMNEIPMLSGSQLLFDLAASADAVVSHHAEFDIERVKSWTPTLYAALTEDGKPWLCTMEDFRWPLGHKQGSLPMLALDHGLGISTLHRALTDCRLIARLFDRMVWYGEQYALAEMFRVAMRPKGLFVGLQKFDDNQKAKDAGFKWDRLIPNKWARRMAIEDAKLLDFPVKQVEIV